MRILHVLHTSLPFICGYSIRSDYLIRSQREQGIEAAVATSAQHPNGADLEEELQGVRHWRTPALKGRPIPLAREWRLMLALGGRVRQAIREWQPDLVHAHSPMLVGLPALSAARNAGLPLVYEVRDLWENASVDRGKFAYGSAPYRIARRMETHLLRRADAVVTICEALREELAPRAGGQGRVHVVGNGVDARAFDPNADGGAARQKWQLEGRRVIGYVGTFQPYEGLDLLIAALPEIRRRVPEAHLVITGSGGVEVQLRTTVRQLGIENCVTFTGRLPHGEVGSIYALADVLVYPRILTRVTALTTPLKPLEAMMMARPVIVSDVPALHELVQPGRTGLMFRAGDVADLAARCVDLLQSEERRAEIGGNAREWVLRERQWGTLVARYSSIYRRALSRSRAAPGPNQLRRPAVTSETGATAGVKEGSR